MRGSWRTTRVLAVLALAWLIGTGHVFAQAGTASLRGTVTDDQGGALPGATVTASSSATGAARTTVTDAGGVVSAARAAARRVRREGRAERLPHRGSPAGDTRRRLVEQARHDAADRIAQRDGQRHDRGLAAQHHRRLARQRHHRAAGPHASARGQQRRRPAEPAAGRGLRPEFCDHGRADRRRAEHRSAQWLGQRQPRRSVERHP